MTTIIDEIKVDNNKKEPTLISYLYKENEVGHESTNTAITHYHATNQQIFSSKLNSHVPEAGLNTLVDVAANVFSQMGKIIHMKECHDLPKLHDEIISDIKRFQETIEAYSCYANRIAEYKTISTFALCVTLDNIISDRPWGGHGKWNSLNLTSSIFSDPPSQRNFFLILERLVRDPDIYIDVMEFMYLCLSFGFKGRNDSHTLEFSHEQLEQIIDSLYKRIRTFRGNFSKTLSPFPLKTKQPIVVKKVSITHAALWAMGLSCVGVGIVALCAAHFYFKLF